MPQLSDQQHAQLDGKLRELQLIGRSIGWLWTDSKITGAGAVATLVFDVDQLPPAPKPKPTGA